MNLSIEQSIIYCLITKEELAKEVVIKSDYFLDNLNKFCFEILIKQYQEHKQISLSALQEYKHLFKYYTQEKVLNYLIEIMEDYVSINQFQYFQECLIKEYKNHMIIKNLELLKQNQISQEELLENIHTYENLTISNNGNKPSGSDIYKIITQENKKINFRLKLFSEVSNIQENDFVVVSARPGIGKTAFILNLIEDVSDRYKCILFNMEMSEKQVYRRLLGIHSGMKMNTFSDIQTDYQSNIIKEYCDGLASKNIEVVTGTQNLRTIKSKILRESKEEHVIAFIDYVGLIRGIQKNQSNYERVTEIVKELRRVSMEYNCTIVLVAQINRNAESQRDNRPKVSDLKESGELEQSATTVIMLHNEDPYNEGMRKVQEIDLIIGKNRNGRTGMFKIEYDKESQRFDEPKRI